jgi:magnesium transporter
MNSPSSGLATTQGPDSLDRQGEGDRAPGHALRARAARQRASFDSDAETMASSAISTVTPTTCQARTRLYRNGRLVSEGFPVADISDHLADASATVWLDLYAPDHEDLAVLSEEFGLHPMAVEDAVVD